MTLPKACLFVLSRHFFTANAALTAASGVVACTWAAKLGLVVAAPRDLCGLGVWNWKDIGLGSSQSSAGNNEEE